MTFRPEWPTPTAGIKRLDGSSSTDDCSRDSPFAHLTASRRLVAAGVPGNRFRCRRYSRLHPTRVLVAADGARPFRAVPGFLDPARTRCHREELPRAVPALFASGAL